MTESELVTETEIAWLSPEKFIIVERTVKIVEVEVQARVVTLSYPEGKVGCVWPKITYGEWIDVPDKDEE